MHDPAVFPVIHSCRWCGSPAPTLATEVRGRSKAPEELPADPTEAVHVEQWEQTGAHVHCPNCGARGPTVVWHVDPHEATAILPFAALSVDWARLRAIYLWNAPPLAPGYLCTAVGTEGPCARCRLFIGPGIIVHHHEGQVVCDDCWQELWTLVPAR